MRVMETFAPDEARRTSGGVRRRLIGAGSRTRRLPAQILPDSFLRRVDPRTKLALACAASAAVSLPLQPLAVYAGAFAILLYAAGLAPRAAAQIWRARLWFGAVLLADWYFIGLGFALLVLLRLGLLASAFTLVFATTTADELRLAGERLGLSPRLAFAFAVAFRSIGLLEHEWQGIAEAQRARGITPDDRRWWQRPQLANAAALVVPAVVLTAQRAWSLSEAAAARGFESPHSRPSRTLRLGSIDHILLAAAAVWLCGVYLLR